MGSLHDESSVMENGYKERTLSSTYNHDLEKFSIPLLQKKILQRSCRGPISIKRIDAKGDYVVIENTSIRKPIVMTNWTLRRRGVDVPQNTYKFDKHFVLHPNKSVKIFAKGKCSGQNPHELQSDIKTWGIGTYAFTQLVNHVNQEKASLLEKVEHYERDLQLNVTKSNNASSSSLNEYGNSNGRDHYHGYGNHNDGHTDRQYEFYFEKNVRP